MDKELPSAIASGGKWCQLDASPFMADASQHNEGQDKTGGASENSAPFSFLPPANANWVEKKSCKA